METIYKKRIELNNWEILGIERYFSENFNLNEFIYSDKTIHVDINEQRFGIYKISNGEDIYITEFLDEEQNKNFRLNLANCDFSQLDEEFNHIEDQENIFN